MKNVKKVERSCVTAVVEHVSMRTWRAYGGRERWSRNLDGHSHAYVWWAQCANAPLQTRGTSDKHGIVWGFPFCRIGSRLMGGKPNAESVLLPAQSGLTFCTYDYLIGERLILYKFVLKLGINKKETRP